MRYAGDAGVVSQSPEQLRKMMGVIMVVWPGVQPNARVRIPRWDVNYNADLSLEIDQCILGGTGYVEEQKKE